MSKLRDRLYNRSVLSDEDSCWLWLGGDNGDGYGAMWYDGKPRRTHRLSYQAHIGLIPDGMDVLHSCDNRRCINPYHLFLGTRSDNNKDRHRKGRYNTQARGERNGNVRLTAEQVKSIRDMTDTTSHIARVFGVSRATVRSIRNNHTWRHIDA